MIESKSLIQRAHRCQTTVDNIVREYLQHLFLSSLYREKGSDALLFKGGTALRIVWGSPRFSEDLDFTGVKISSAGTERLLEAALLTMEQAGIEASIEESKKTSGGHLAIFHFKAEDYHSSIQTQISQRPFAQGHGTTALVRADLVPSYTVVHLDEKHLVEEKILACLSRAKARDFYDLYFILRNRLAFREVFGKNKTLKNKLLGRIKKEHLDLRGELKRFLPMNQHGLLKDFKSSLLDEIQRNLP